MSRQLLTTCIVILVVHTATRADDWPQWMGPNRDGVWHETGIVKKFPEGGPKVLWRAKIGSGYAGPAVADGRVYVHDYVTEADFRKISNPSLRKKIEGTERVQCFNAKTGDLIWEHKYDCPYEISYPAGPRCTPTVHGGKVYTLGSEGDLYCFDAAKGTVLWSKNFKKDYKAKTPIWGFCGHPLIVGNKLITVMGGEGSVAIAFDKDTGKEAWKALSSPEPGYSPPTLIEAGGKKQVIIFHAESVNSLDPETGELYWSNPLKPAFGMAIMAPQKFGDHLFASGAFGASSLLKLDANKPYATEVLRGGKDKSIYPINMTPLVDNGIMYGSDADGAFRAIKFDTGERLWESIEPTGGKKINNGTAFLIKNGDRFFLFSETGHLIIAKLSAKGYEEISRAKIIEPTGISYPRDVVWSHPAFANKCCYARNDKELVCVGLGE